VRYSSTETRWLRFEWTRFYHEIVKKGISMKRFALLFASLVLSIQIAGCGDESTTATRGGGGVGGAATSDPPTVGEAKKDQDKRKAEAEARVAKAAAKAAARAAKKSG
jgi:hypothetical protein